MWGADFYMETHDKETFRNDLLSFVAWCKSMGGGFHAYDLTCGFWDSNSAIGAWAQVISVFSAKSGAKLPNDQVSVFVEEDDKHIYSQHPDFNTFQIGMREDLLRALPLSGVPFHFYLPEDALRFDLTTQSRILLFGNASHMTAAQAEQIRKKYGNSGRIIIWNYLPGYLSRDNPADVCKFRIVPNPSVDRKPLSILPGVDNPATEGLAGFNTNISTLRAGIQWQVKDPVAEILAVYRDTPFGAMAAKEYEDHMEIWIGQAGAITPQMIRNLAKMVNMTPVISTDEPTFVGSGMLALQAAFQGKKEITIPAPWTEFKVLTGQKQVEMKGKNPVFTLKAGETLILEVD